MDRIKLGAIELVLAVVAVLMFVDSFLPWYSVSINVPQAAITSGLSTNGWSTGIGAWLPVLLIVALGVMAALPAFGVAANVRGGYLLYTLLAALAVLIILIRWVTYPSVGADYAPYMSVGAGAGTYIGLGLAIAAMVVAYRGFANGGGSLGQFKQAFAKQDRE